MAPASKLPIEAALPYGIGMALIRCEECGRSVSDRAAACPQCGCPVGESYFDTRRGYARHGYEYRSKTMVLGVPLIHVAQGWDRKSGRRLVAKGIVAIGDIAIGGIAVGGCALGVFSLGGMSLGYAALGGLAVGVGLAAGGLAVGGVALGGLAIGYFSLGALAIGPHALGENAQDPAAVEFFRQWVMIPRQSRGPLIVSRSKRLGGVADAAPVVVGHPKGGYL